MSRHGDPFAEYFRTIGIDTDQEEEERRENQFQDYFDLIDEHINRPQTPAAPAETPVEPTPEDPQPDFAERTKSTIMAGLQNLGQRLQEFGQNREQKKAEEEAEAQQAALAAQQQQAMMQQANEQNMLQGLQLSQAAGTSPLQPGMMQSIEDPLLQPEPAPEPQVDPFSLLTGFEGPPVPEQAPQPPMGPESFAPSMVQEPLPLHAPVPPPQEPQVGIGPNLDSPFAAVTDAIMAERAAQEDERQQAALTGLSTALGPGGKFITGAASQLVDPETNFGLFGMATGLPRRAAEAVGMVEERPPELDALARAARERNMSEALGLQGQLGEFTAGAGLAVGEALTGRGLASRLLSRAGQAAGAGRAGQALQRAGQAVGEGGFAALPAEEVSFVAADIAQDRNPVVGAAVGLGAGAAGEALLRRFGRQAREIRDAAPDADPTEIARRVEALKADIADRGIADVDEDQLATVLRESGDPDLQDVADALELEVEGVRTEFDPIPEGTNTAIRLPDGTVIGGRIGDVVEPHANLLASRPDIPDETLEQGVSGFVTPDEGFIPRSEFSVRYGVTGSEELAPATGRELAGTRRTLQEQGRTGVESDPSDVDFLDQFRTTPEPEPEVPSTTPARVPEAPEPEVPGPRVLDDTDDFPADPEEEFARRGDQAAEAGEYREAARLYREAASHVPRGWRQATRLELEARRMDELAGGARVLDETDDLPLLDERVPDVPVRPEPEIDEPRVPETADPEDVADVVDEQASEFARTAGQGQGGFVALGGRGAAQGLDGVSAPGVERPGARRFLSSAGDIPEPIFRRRLQANHEMQALAETASQNARDLRSAMRKVLAGESRFQGALGAPVRRAAGVILELGDSQRVRQLRNQVDEALKGNRDFTDLPVEIEPIARKMRADLDELGQIILDEGLAEGQLAASIAENMGVWMHRTYRVWQNESWGDEVLATIKKDPEGKLARAANKLKANMRSQFPEWTEAQIERELGKIIGAGADSSRNPLGSLLDTGIPKDLSITKPRRGFVPQEMVDRIHSVAPASMTRAEVDDAIQAIRDGDRFNPNVKTLVKELNAKAKDVQVELDLQGSARLRGSRVKESTDRLRDKTERITEAEEKDIARIEERAGRTIESLDDQAIKDITGIEAEQHRRQVRETRAAGRRGASRRSAEQLSQGLGSAERRAQRDIDAALRRGERGVERAGLVEEGALQRTRESAARDRARAQVREAARAERKSLEDQARDLKEARDQVLKDIGDRFGISPEVRTLMGEVTDVDVNYVNSMAKAADFIARSRMLRDMADLEGTLIFRSQDEAMEKLGAKHAGEVIQLAGETAERWAPLIDEMGEVWAARHWVESLEAMNETYAPNAIWKGLLRTTAAVKGFKTVGQIGTHVRNFVGGNMFMLSQGHLSAFNVHKYPGRVARAAGVATAGGGASESVAHLVRKGKSVVGFLDDATKATEDARELFRYYQSIGIVGGDAVVGDLRRAFRELDMANHGSFADSFMRRLIQRTTKEAASVYQAEDDVFRILAFESELQRHQAAYVKKGKPIPDDLEQVVADKVRNTYQTWELTPQWVKNLSSRVPVVGTFPSFTWQVFRTMAHTYKILADELGDDVLREVGIQRAAGLAQATIATPSAIAWGMHAHGITAEDDEAMREFVAPWDRNASLIYTSPLQGGQAQYVNASYTDPYSAPRDAAWALIRAAQEDDLPAILEGSWQAARVILDPFISTDIATDAILEARANRDSFGNQITDADPTRQFDRWIMDMGEHLLTSAFMPGVFNEAIRVAESLEGRDIEGGFQRSTPNEIGALFGVRQNDLNIPRALSFRARDLAEEIRDAEKPLREVFLDRGVVTEEDLRKAYIESEALRQRRFDEGHKMSRLARRAGVSAERVADAFVGVQGISNEEARQIAEGTYTLREIPDNFLQTATEDIIRDAGGPVERFDAAERFRERARILRRIRIDLARARE